MTTKTKNENHYKESDLLPYPIIVAATKGDPDAMNTVMNHFHGFMYHLSLRKIEDKKGNIYYGVDSDTYDRLRTRLIKAVLSFKA